MASKYAQLMDDFQFRVKNVHMSMKSFQDSPKFSQETERLEKLQLPLKIIPELISYVEEMRWVSTEKQYADDIIHYLESIQEEVVKCDYDKVIDLLDRTHFRLQQLSGSFTSANISVMRSMIDDSGYLFNITVNRILNTEKEINVLEYEASFHNHVRDVALSKANVNYYAITQRLYHAKDIRELGIAKKIITGTGKNARISNNAFDVLIIDPKSDMYSIVNTNRAIEHRETKEVKDAYKYLRKNGTLVISMPYYRYNKTMSAFLAKNFSDIRLYSFQVSDDGRFDGLHFITFVGKKTPSSTIDEEQFLRLMRLYKTRGEEARIDDSKTEFPPIYVNPELMEIANFKGAEYDPHEAISLLRSSDLISNTYKNESITTEREKKPLLPLDAGLLGLVITSGAADGIIDEGNGYGHVVKGTVEKRIDSKTVEDFDTMTRVNEDVENNIVKISVFLPDGTYKKIF